MLSAEGIGKNIEQAIENALFELKAVREDVDIKILSEGGLFKKAKVLVTISEDAREKYEKKEVSRKAEKEAEQVEKQSAEDNVEVKAEATQSAVKREVKEKKNKEVKEMKVETEENETSDKEDEEEVSTEWILKNF